MVDVAVGCGLGFGACAHRDCLDTRAGYAVGILQREARFVLGAGLQIENAAGKHVGRHVAVGAGEADRDGGAGGGGAAAVPGLGASGGGPPPGEKHPRECTSSPCRRSSGRPVFHGLVPFSRYATWTEALRLASPEMRHSNPRFSRVGRSTKKSPATTGSTAAAIAMENGPALNSRAAPMNANVRRIMKSPVLSDLCRYISVSIHT